MTGLPASGLVVLPSSVAGASGVAAGPQPTLADVLMVREGQVLAARVASAAEGGTVELALAGRTISARTDLPLAPGQTLALVVDRATAEAITLRLLPADAAGDAPGQAVAGRGTPGAAGTGSAPAPATLPEAAARALAAEAGPSAGTGDGLAARASSMGVRTPGAAAAMVRLQLAGLPVTPASVAGMAVLIEGPPVGRALAEVATGAQGAATGQPPAPGAASAAAPGRPAATAQPGAPAPAPPPAAAAPGAPAPAPVATPAGAPAAPPQPASGDLAALGAALARLTAEAGQDAVSGDPTRLARALRHLGQGLEARLAAGDGAQEPSARALLGAVARHPDAPAALAQAAERAADGLAAQPLAAPPPPSPSSQASAQGAYLQVPLPGGQTAEVRVSPEEGEGGGGSARPRRIAFLLHMSALGPVVIEAVAGRAGVEAAVRVASDPARAFCAERAGELGAALAQGGTRARISVERMRGPAPGRLVPPPPTGLVDATA